MSAKLITDESGIDKVFGPMHQSDMTKIKNYVSKDWIVKTLLEHVLRFLIHRSNRKMKTKVASSDFMWTKSLLSKE